MMKTRVLLSFERILANSMKKEEEAEKQEEEDVLRPLFENSYKHRRSKLSCLCDIC